MLGAKDKSPLYSEMSITTVVTSPAGEDTNVY